MNEKKELGRPSVAVALLLSLCCAIGVGHAYAGRPRRGLAWIAGNLAFIPAIAVLAHAARDRGFTIGISLFVLAAVGAWIGAAVDVYRVASTSAQRGTFGSMALLWLGVQLLSISAAMVTRAFVVEAFKLPSASMVPTLLVGDHVFIAKSGWTPRRGAVVVFPFPERPNQDFLKRVVALPGDRIAFDNGHPVLNGTPIPSCSVGEYAYDETDAPIPHHEGELFVEVLDGHPYLALFDHEAGGFPEQQGPWTVQPGEVFMLGDNRNNSHDSRMWRGGQGGGVPIGTVRGETLVIWLSVTDRGIDWSRQGHALDELHAPGNPALDPAIAKCLEILHVR